MVTAKSWRKWIMLVLLAWAGWGLFASQITCSRQSAATPAAAAKQDAAPSPTNNVRPAMKWKRFDYTCEAGAKISVYLRDTTAKVRTSEHIYMMRQTRSGDGNRYSDGKVL